MAEGAEWRAAGGRRQGDTETRRPYVAAYEGKLLSPVGRACAPLVTDVRHQNRVFTNGCLSVVVFFFFDRLHLHPGSTSVDICDTTSLKWLCFNFLIFFWGECKSESSCWTLRGVWKKGCSVMCGEGYLNLYNCCNTCTLTREHKYTNTCV